MRNVNPGDLEQLAKLIDGKGGVGDKLKGVFTQASALGVSSTLSPLKPLAHWATDNGPDLRKRAAFARLEDGDPKAGIRWAGFTTEEIKKYQGQGPTPSTLLLANSLAASDDPKASGFQRKSNESFNDWVERVEAHAIAQIPGLTPHEETIKFLVGAYNEVTGITSTGVRTIFMGSTLTRVLVQNSIVESFGSTRARAWVQSVQNSTYRVLRSFNATRVTAVARRIRDWNPALRSLSAPGTWLPTRLVGFASQNPLIQRLGNAPGFTALRNWGVNRGWTRLGELGFMSNPLLGRLTPNGAISFFLGSNSLAERFGGLTHSDQQVTKAAQAGLVRVGRNAFAASRGANIGRGASLLRGLGASAKVSGFLRGVGIAGGLFATYRSADQLYHRGLPWQNGNFSSRKKGASYVADVAEFGFNGSLTLATVAPSPWTYGATAAFGAIYLGAKAVEHWEDVKKAPGKAAHWVKHTAEDIGSGAIDTAKKAGKALNPSNWF
ncbi:PE-PGRS family protein [Streptomyces sp. NPDC005355]|uniref:PE-PGRS family protein n=1 Tax=unclassified Streptomyces TaxID=2593676 RepID=UPI0033A65090